MIFRYFDTRTTKQIHYSLISTLRSECIEAESRDT